MSNQISAVALHCRDANSEQPVHAEALCIFPPSADPSLSAPLTVGSLRQQQKNDNKKTPHIAAAGESLVEEAVGFPVSAVRTFNGAHES